MLDRFRAHLETSGLIPPGSRVLLGYSGGADSTCLLHLLAQCGVDVIAGYLHHGQRAGADKELNLCQTFADSLDVPFVSGKANVPELAAQMKIGLEEAGREARYSFFRQAAFRLDCTHIATAHTRDDQVETVLLHLARGAGLSGLGGIPEKRDNIVRPLLPFSREETRAYCRLNGFWIHDDPANADLSFSRARIRHRVLPELRSINSAADEAIARMATIASDEDRFLNGMAAAALERSELRLNGELRFLTLDVEAAFDLEKLRHLPTVLLRRALRLASASIGGELTYEQTALAESGVASSGKGSLTSEGGRVALEWSPAKLHVRVVTPDEPFRYPLTIPGETESEDFGWNFRAFHAPQPQGVPQRRCLKVELRASAVKGPLYFRASEASDLMTPLGFDKKRKLADLLSEAKLTKAARHRLPIVCDLAGPIWAPGVCLDERARPNGGAVICLEFSSIQAA